MLQLAGPPALSAFRLAKLLERLRALEPTVAEVAARFVHFIDLAEPLSTHQQEILRQLLSYGPTLPLAPDDHGELFGFIEVEELLFGERSSVVLDPSEERIKSEFSGVKRTFLPMHSILRIDEVKKHGTAKITVLESGAAANVAQFPIPMYSTPPGEKK